jgi:translin
VSDRGGFRRRVEVLVDGAADALGDTNRARETALPAARLVIQRCGSAIKAVHRLDGDAAQRYLAEAGAELVRAHAAVADQPIIAHAGFLSDAEKEYAEARCLVAIVANEPIPDAGDLGISASAWLRGLAEAASELRRHLLDRLRADDPERADELFAAMEDVYDALMTVDFPDVVTGGLRRTLDALRAVIERTRSDLTTTTLQRRLQLALELASSAESAAGV